MAAPDRSAISRTDIAVDLRGVSKTLTVKECIAHLPQGVGLADGVLGVLSLMFWSLVLIVCVKYLGFVTKADNEGEGGMFSILGLLKAKAATLFSARGMSVIVLMAVVGSGLILGDGVITPSLSIMTLRGHRSRCSHFVSCMYCRASQSWPSNSRRLPVSCGLLVSTR